MMRHPAPVFSHLVLFLIGGRGLDFYTFAFVSLLAMAVHFPRLAQWEEWAKDMAPSA